MSTYKILSFCGGGIRGLMSVKMLQRLQKANPGLLQRTNMLTGCSTGSIISGFLAMYKHYNNFESEQHVQDALSELEYLYKTVMPDIFSRGNTRNPMEPENDDRMMKEFLEAIALKVGTTPAELAGLTMGDLKSSFDLMFPAFNIRSHTQKQPGDHLGTVENNSWGMSLFTNLGHSATNDVYSLEAVIASGSMPGMTGSSSVHTTNKRRHLGEFVDGAFVNHDPTMAAVSLAVSQGHKLEDISVICFGTGFMRNYIENQGTASWGSAQWLNSADNFNQTDIYNTSRIPSLFVNEDRVNPIINMCLNGTSTNEIPTQSSLLLGQRYAYLNPDLHDVYIPEDAHGWPQLEKMENYADAVHLDSANDVINKNWY